VFGRDRVDSLGAAAGSSREPLGLVMKTLLVSMLAAAAFALSSSHVTSRQAKKRRDLVSSSTRNHQRFRSRSRFGQGQVDLVFICDVLHHVWDRPAWLSTITTAMPSGARLVLIEFKEGNLPQGPPESMKIPRDELVKLATDAGLVLVSEMAELLPYQTFLVFRKP